jgi:RNA polymerase sigma factor (sigma-70 family)
MEHRQSPEETAAACLNPLYRYLRGKTACLQDAEDLTQEILMRYYRALCAAADDGRKIAAPEAFLRIITRNTLANYYRGRSRSFIGAGPPDENLPDRDLPLPGDRLEREESAERLRDSVARLSSQQRRIVLLYYYHGKKQREIAELLGIPAGTVKWHLSRAKDELRKGMKAMKTVEHLKFDPVRLCMLGISGSVGSSGCGTDTYLRGALAQNLAYAVYRQARTINEIADLLGVSPVYVESEAACLADNGFLLRLGDRYLANLLIDEPDAEVERLKDELYTAAARLTANALFDELSSSSLLSDASLCYPDGDRNFLMWTLPLYLLANTGEEEDTVSFEQAATLRPDGGHYVASACVVDEAGEAPPRLLMEGWCGPMWNERDGLTLWQVNTPWCDRLVDFHTYVSLCERGLSLMRRFYAGESLSPDDIAFLVEQGLLRHTVPGGFSPAVAALRGGKIRDALLELGRRVRSGHRDALRPYVQRYRQALLDRTPPQMHTARRYSLQYLLSADSNFLFYALHEWLESGRLQPPAEKQRRSLTTLLIAPH